MRISYSSLENQQVSLRRRWADYSQKVTASLEIKKPKGHLLVLDGVRAAACLAVLLHHIVYQIVLPAHWSGLWKPSGTIQVIFAALLSFGASGVILFFLLLPLIAWILSLVVRRGTLRWRITKLVSCLLVILGWGLLSRWWGLFVQPSATSFPQSILAALQPYYYGDNGKYFESFAVGMLLAILYVYIQNAPRGEILRKKLQRWSSRMFLIGLLILGFLAIYVFCVPSQYGAAFVFLDPYRTMLSQIYAQWQSIGYSICSSLCVCASLSNSGRLKRPFEWSVLRWIGLFSFSLYMWHLPLLFLFMNIISQQFQGVGHTVQSFPLLPWFSFLLFPFSLPPS